MNHDIAHCRGERCELREMCHRYKAHEDLKNIEDKLPYYPYVEPQRSGNDCESFWREGNE